MTDTFSPAGPAGIKDKLGHTLGSAGTLALGTLPLMRAGVLGSMTPVAAAKALGSMYQWEFQPASLLAIGAARDPFHTAIIDDRGSMTYQELHNQVNQLAKALFRTGIRERDRIGVLTRNHRGFIMALCAHGRLGTDLVLFNTGASAEQTRAVARENKLDVLFIDEEFIPLLPKDFDDCPVIVAHEFGDTVGLTREAEEALPMDSNIRDALAMEDHATRSEDWPSLSLVLRTTPAEQTIPSRPRRGRTIILTSGTTGTPRGTRRPEPPSYLPASSIMSRIPLKARRPFYLAAPMFHTWGFANIQLALALRSTMVMQRKFRPEDAVQLIEANRPYAIAIVPTMLRRLLEAVPEGMDPGTKVIAASGEPIPPQIVEKTFEKFGPALYNLYGSTEVSWATIANPGDLQRHPNTAGKPPMATVVKVLDEDFRECPDGEVGRIFVANNMMFEGYTRPGKDKETHEGMIATGDLGYWEDGLLFVSGRSDDMVVSGGENVYPTDTEHIIGTLPEILEVCVQGVPDDEFGQALCAWIVTKEELSAADKQKLQEEIKATVSKQLARFAVPRHFVYVDSLPRNAVGKVIRRELPRPETAAAA